MLRRCDVTMLRMRWVEVGVGGKWVVGSVVLVARKGLVLVGDFTVGIVERRLGDGER